MFPFILILFYSLQEHVNNNTSTRFFDAALKIQIHAITPAGEFSKCIDFQYNLRHTPLSSPKVPLNTRFNSFLYYRFKRLFL